MESSKDIFQKKYPVNEENKRKTYILEGIIVVVVVVVVVRGGM